MVVKLSRPGRKNQSGNSPKFQPVKRDDARGREEFFGRLLGLFQQWFARFTRLATSEERTGYNSLRRVQ